MRRALALIIMFVLAGAMVNVALAWGAAAFSPLSNKAASLHYEFKWRDDVAKWWRENCPFAGSSEPVEEYPDAGERFRRHRPTRDAIETCSLPGLEIVAASGTELQSTKYGALSVQRFQSGWPWYSLIAARWRNASESKHIIADGIYIYPPKTNEFQDQLTFQMNGRLLPLRPIWPGFAINTILYAATLWVLFTVPGKVRRTFRRRRGLCPACAYPVGTSPVCTECGEPCVLNE